MKTTQAIFFALILPSLLLSACKNESGGGSVTTPSLTENLESGKNQDGGCAVVNVDGGAQISCGKTSAFISNGSQGPQGAPGGINSPLPRLVLGGSAPHGPEVIVGDFVISIAKSSDHKDSITVWVSSVDAIAQYEDGIISPILDAVFFDSSDCTGQAMAPTLKGNSLVGVMGDRLIFVDAYYKVSNSIVSCYARSKRNKDGTCTEITGPMSNFYALKAEKVNPGITTVLPPGYRIKVK